MENIVLLTFDERTTADEAMSELRRHAAKGALSVNAAVSVERTPDGGFRARENADNVGLIEAKRASREQRKAEGEETLGDKLRDLNDEVTGRA